MRPLRLALAVAAVLLLAGIAAGVVAAWPLLPFQQRWARARWHQRRQPRLLVEHWILSSGQRQS